MSLFSFLPQSPLIQAPSLFHTTAVFILGDSYQAPQFSGFLQAHYFHYLAKESKGQLDT